jgi:hypothetical protein
LLIEGEMPPEEPEDENDKIPTTPGIKIPMPEDE